MTFAGVETQVGTNNPGGKIESIDGNFLTEVMEKPMRKGVLMDLVLTNKEGLVGGMKVGPALSTMTTRSWSLVSCKEEGSRAMSKIPTLDFRTDNFGFFRDLLGRIQWEWALEGRG